MCHNKCRSRNIWKWLYSVWKYNVIFTLKTQNFHRLPFSTGINISFLSWKDANVMQLYLLWRRSKNLVIFTSLSNTNFGLNQVETKQKINIFCRKNMWRHPQNIDRAIIILQHHFVFVDSSKSPAPRTLQCTHISTSFIVRSSAFECITSSVCHVIWHENRTKLKIMSSRRT